jgi:hypothetical protein
MMKKLLQILLAFSVAFVTSCKIDEPESPLKGNVYNTYQPVSKGSYWKYTKTSATGSTGETQTITGGKDLINKKIYYTIRTQSATTDDTLSHFSHKGDSYVFRTESKNAGVSIEYLYLKDDYIIGRTWKATLTDDGVINGVPAQIVGAVLEKGITKYVSDKKFNEVVHTRLNFQYNYGTGYTTAEVIDYYVAKGIGIIEIDYSDGTTIKASNKITDYNIE